MQLVRYWRNDCSVFLLTQLAVEIEHKQKVSEGKLAKKQTFANKPGVEFLRGGKIGRLLFLLLIVSYDCDDRDKYYWVLGSDGRKSMYVMPKNAACISGASKSMNFLPLLDQKIRKKLSPHSAKLVRVCVRSPFPQSRLAQVGSFDRPGQKFCFRRRRIHISISSSSGEKEKDNPRFETARKFICE